MSEFFLLSAVLPILIFIVTCVGIACFSRKVQKVRAKKDPKELIKEIYFNEPIENFLCSSVNLKWNSGIIVVKKIEDVILGSIFLKFMDVGSKITVGDKEFHIRMDLTSSQFVKKCLFTTAKDGSEKILATFAQNHHDYVGECNISFGNGREIQIVRSFAKSYLSREFVVKEDGENIGRIMGRFYIIYSFLPSNIPDEIKLFIIMTKQREGTLWFNRLGISDLK